MILLSKPVTAVTGTDLGQRQSYCCVQIWVALCTSTEQPSVVSGVALGSHWGPVAREAASTPLLSILGLSFFCFYMQVFFFF